MKTIGMAVLGMMFSLTAFSQDILFTRSGKVIPAKVYEINQTDIKYKKPSNPDGPLYTISKEDIAVIEYKNGTKDVFESGEQVASVAKNDNSYASNNATPQVNNYYTVPPPRPAVNVVLGMGMPYWGPTWGWYRPYRPYYYYGRGWGGYGYHHGGYHHGHYGPHR